MDRRTFLSCSGSGLVLAYLGPLAGCAATSSSDAADYDPGPYRVGSEHLIFDGDGGAWVLDVTGHQVHRLDDAARSDGSFSSLGTEPGELNHPIDAVFDGGTQRLYVLDRGNGRIQVFDPSGELIGVHDEDLHLPRDLLLYDGRLYVCDTLNHRVQVFDLEGQLVGSLGGRAGEDHALNGPLGITAAVSGDLHVLDGGDASVQVFAADGSPGIRYGAYGDEPGAMLGPGSITSTGDGRVFVTDAHRGLVHVFDESGDFIGRFRPVDDDGVAVAPIRISAMQSGSLYVWTAGHAAHPTGTAE